MVVDRTGSAIGIKQIELDGEEYPIKVKIGDVYNYLNKVQKAQEEKLNALSIQKEFVEKLFLQGNKTMDVDDLKLTIELNFQEALKKVLIALKLATKESFDNKEEIEKAKN